MDLFQPPATGGDVAGMVTGAREWNSNEMRALVERLLPHTQAHR
jgi:hypothetical protein